MSELNEEYIMELNLICQNPVIKGAIEKTQCREVKPDKYLEDKYRYINKFTGCSADTQRELDNVKYLGQKYAFSYEKLLDVFTKNYLPATSYAHMDSLTRHNLFRALVEYFSSQGGCDDILAQTIEQISRMIADNQFKPDEYLRDLKYQDPNFLHELNHVYNESKASQLVNLNDYFYNVASYLHYKYGDLADENKDYYVINQKEKENERYYGIGEREFSYEFINNLVDEEFKEAFVTVWQGYKLARKGKLQDRESKNSFDFQLNPLKTEFASSEIIKSLDCFVHNWESVLPLEKLFCGTDLLKELPSSILIENNAEDSSKNGYKDLNDLLKERFNIPENDTTLIDSMPEKQTSSGVFLKNESIRTSLNDFEFESRVRKVIVDVLDDFARLKGFDNLHNA